MPRYPMLLTQLLKYTDTDENKENESLMKEVKLLDQAKNCIQVTVSETNKRAGEEDLKNLLTDIKTHLNISMFLVGMMFYIYIFNTLPPWTNRDARLRPCGSSFTGKNLCRYMLEH